MSGGRRREGEERAVPNRVRSESSRWRPSRRHAERVIGSSPNFKMKPRHRDPIETIVVPTLGTVHTCTLNIPKEIFTTKNPNTKNRAARRENSKPPCQVLGFLGLRPKYDARM